MSRIVKIFITVTLSMLLVSTLAPAEPVFDGRISKVDPQSGVELDAYDKLYMQVDYNSGQQVRFKVVPLRKGLEVEYGAMTSSTMVWPAGEKVALAWLSFPTTTHVDAVRIVALGPDWDKVGQFEIKFEALWDSTPVETPREPVEWVKKLIRKNRLRQELAFDPNPQQKEVIYDTVFYLTMITIPFFLILQVQFLRKWRGRWRELAAIPLISITPLLFMALLGLGIELRLWIIFIFRGMPLALIYLVVLWFAKRVSERERES
jgi:hypothetical protein